MLALLGDMTNAGKRRRLLSIQDRTGFDIFLAEIEKKEQFEDFFVYPTDKGRAIFARPRDPVTVLLMEKYNALPMLKDMIGHAADILRLSYCFFQGRPFKLTIIKA